MERQEDHKETKNDDPCRHSSEDGNQENPQRYILEGSVEQSAIIHQKNLEDSEESVKYHRGSIYGTNAAMRNPPSERFSLADSTQPFFRRFERDCNHGGASNLGTQIKLSMPNCV